VNFGLYGLHKGSSVEPARLGDRARRAEEAGFESLWVGDHIALPMDAPDPPDEPRLELVTTLTYLAAVTSRVRLATGVAILPMRHPVLLAKQLASIDVLSSGRLIIGIGVGYVERELKALGASLADRGARTEEHLAAMLALWDEAAPAFAGRFVSFDGVMERPLPVQRPHPPIVCGGHGPVAYRRAVTFAAGWYAWGLEPEQVVEAVQGLRDASLRYGRDPELGELEITVTPPTRFDRDMALRYAEAGVHRLVLEARTSAGSAIDELIDWAGNELISSV
jgi:probable F420-dependent oxidoreductase